MNMILACYAGEAIHPLKDGRVRRFRPKGEMLVCTPDGQVFGAKDRKKNPVTRYSEGGLSARLFVGLNVGESPKYTLRQVVDATIEIRKKQHQLPDATFLAQKGVYTEHGGTLVEEDSVQIIIIDIASTPEAEFTRFMTELGEELRTRFEQESVIVEIQRKGVVQSVFGVHA
jgi:hypothetical protein